MFFTGLYLRQIDGIRARLEERQVA